MDLQNDPILKNIPGIKGYKVLGPAVLYGKIGQGGMGAVYRGRHLNLDVDVAVKCLKPSLADESPQFITRFQREAKLAAGIHHENLIHVYDVASEAGVHYLVMEYISGETVRERVRRKGPLKEQEAATILLGGARGLAIAHKKRIVHRDIKPDNILISRDGVVKVADLGIARAVGNDDYATMTHGSLGTPQYMPPEQWIDASKVATTADVWALGATLYFMLVGENAIRATTQGECALRICNSEFPDIGVARPEIDARLRTLLRRMTERDPTQRHANAAEVARELELWLGATAVELADDNAGGSKVQTLVSPPPAQTLGEIRIEIGTKAGTGAAQALQTEAVSHPQATNAVPPPHGRSRRVAFISAGVAGVVLVGLGMRQYLSREPQDGGLERASSLDPQQGLQTSIGQPEIGLDKALAGGVLLTKEPRYELRGLVKDAREETVTVQAAGKSPKTVRLAKGAFEASLELEPNQLNQFTLLCSGAPSVVFAIEHDALAPTIVGLLEPGPLQAMTRERSLDITVEVHDKHLQGVEIEAIEAERQDGAGTRWRAQGVRLTEGKNPIEVVAWDEAGNRGSSSYELVLDTTLPKIVALISPRDGERTNKSTIDVQVQVTDESLAEVQVESVEAKRESGDTWKAGGVRLLDQGPNSLAVQARDKAGNAGTETFSVVLDSEPPRIVAYSPAARDLVPNKSVDVRLEFDEPVAKLVYGRQTLTPHSDSCVVQLEVPKAEGAFSRAFELTDELGNKGTLEHEFHAGALPPTPVIVLERPPVPPTDLLFTRASSLQLEGRVNDAADDALTIAVNGNSHKIPLEGGEFDFDAALPLDQRCRVELRHDEVVRSFEVIQDSRDPEIILQSPAAGTMPTTSAEIDVAVRVQDANLDTVLFDTTPMKAMSEEAWRLEGVKLAEGKNSFLITATDRAGRTGSLSITLTRTIPPAIPVEDKRPVSEARRPEGWLALDALPGHSGWAMRVQEPKSGIVFVLIAPGEFDMGSPPKEKGHEKEETLHRVRLTKAYYLAEAETTQAQYRKVTGKNPSKFEGGDRPVESVTWNDATNFCKQIQCELPSEAQWEYACRAGNQDPFHFGATLPKSLANHFGDEEYNVARDGKGPQTCSVKKYKPNAWGLYDMHGNVWEWCADLYAPYSTTPVTDPFQSRGKERVNRGGSWKLAESASRSARRDKDIADKKYDQLGFRCARNLPD